MKPETRHNASDAEAKLLYIDPFSGVSGDMFLGALLSLGLPEPVLVDAVDKVIPGEVRFDISEVTRSGLAGIRCEVVVTDGPPRRTLDDMITLIGSADLVNSVKNRCIRIMESLGEAEGKAHGAGKAVHLHELGGQDTLADIVGVTTGIFHLGIGEIMSGPINLGKGFVDTEHGVMPVPAPATAQLVKGMPVFARGPAVELTTPTGAALIKELASEFGSVPEMTVQNIGTGAGGRDNQDFPNLLRVFSGHISRDLPIDESVMIECGIDDVSPEYMAPLTASLHEEGALEVHMVPTHTKKGRIGVLLRVLVPSGSEERMARTILDLSGSAGLRFWKVSRKILTREMVEIVSEHGKVRVKRWRSPSGRWRAKPEFEDIRELSESSGIPMGELRERIMAQYYLECGNEQAED
jgi:uncharacterized protein (TIGR00299 family) protein